MTDKEKTLGNALLAFVNARLIDPETGENRGGLLVEAGKISAVGAAVTAANLPAGAAVIDCQGDYVAPGLIDLWASLEESVADCEAAAAGGITTVVVRPEAGRAFEPVGAGEAPIRLLPMGLLADLAAKRGAAAFSEGSKSLVDTAAMQRAMEEARRLDALIVHYCEEPNLAAAGVMNEGMVSRHLGLAGIPPDAETLILDRDLQLVALTGARYHMALVSTSASVELIRQAKAQGLPVNCGISIHHLSFNEIDIGDKNPAYKFAPPLRGEVERQALIAAVADGTIDVITSDHTPHEASAKNLPFEAAACGSVGFELLLSAGLRLVTSGALELPHLIKAMTLRPAQILKLPQGHLCVGAPADLIQFDPDEPYVVEATAFRSRTKNTPFNKARMEGRVKRTVVAGKLVFEAV